MTMTTSGDPTNSLDLDGRFKYEFNFDLGYSEFSAASFLRGVKLLWESVSHQQGYPKAIGTRPTNGPTRRFSSVQRRRLKQELYLLAV